MGNLNVILQGNKHFSEFSSRIFIDQTQKRIAGPSIPEDQLCAYEDSCGTETTDEEETFDEGDSSEVPRERSDDINISEAMAMDFSPFVF